MIRLKPGKLIAFEGIDASGKTVLSNDLLNECDDPKPLLVHQPSSGRLGKQVYSWLEAMGERRIRGLPHQLLHLACHAEQWLEEIEPALKERAVIMDRCWWSTIAYGVYGENLKRYFDPGWELSYTNLSNMVLTGWFVTRPSFGIRPDLVFFLDRNFSNKEISEYLHSVYNGYRQLVQRHYHESAVITEMDRKLSLMEVIGWILDSKLGEQVEHI